MASLIKKIAKKSKYFDTLMGSIRESLKNNNSPETLESLFEQQAIASKEARRQKRNKRKAAR